MNGTKSHSSANNFLLLFLLFIASSSGSRANPQTDAGCSLVDCGQGTCKASNTSIFGIDCECYPGWKNIRNGPFTFPSCILPNCTINFGCNGAAPTQSPWAQPASSVPSPSPPLLLNLSNPCSLIWCGEGVCLAKGTGYRCKCNAGASNLMNLTDLPCLNPCSLGPNCRNTSLGLDFPPPPGPYSSRASTPPSPPPGSTSSAGQRVLTVLPLAAMFFAWL